MLTLELMLMMKRLHRDTVVASTAISVLLISIVLSIYVSSLLGISILFSYFTGCIVTITLLQRRSTVIRFVETARRLLKITNNSERTNKETGCDVCGVAKCNRRHQTEPVREPWLGLLVDEDLDKAIDSFFTRIFSSFVDSWFSLLTNDATFVRSLKINLREACSRLILKLKHVNAPELITDRLLPSIFDHYECIQTMLLKDGIPMDRLAQHFQQQLDHRRPLHPAVLNRQSELDYLRSVAVCLIPRLCPNHNFDSKTFFSLTRELLANFCLLPLMDVISDPNLINLLVIVATNRPARLVRAPAGRRVVFLERFVSASTNGGSGCNDGATDGKITIAENAILTDQSQLYAFMQFLKREGAVDLLRFYLDVDGLNHDLLDPKVTTNPAKLSTLQQQSEKLLATYQKMMATTTSTVTSLAEAHEHARHQLQGKWQRAFHGTTEYFHLVYGNREIRNNEEFKDPSGPASGFRLGSKLKGVLRSAIDGAPLDGTEIPTVWDTLGDDVPSMSGVPPGLSATNSAHANQTIYTSVTQKLRKERGQHLESFIAQFMASIEFKTEIGEEELLQQHDDEVTLKRRVPERKLTPPGRSLVFGDLFEIRRKYYPTTTATERRHNASGPSKCFVYIVAKVLRIPMILVRLVLALVTVSSTAADQLICWLIDKLIRIGLYEPRLTTLITALESHLFGPQSAPATPTELLKRQVDAKQRLERVCPGLSSVVDVLQSPPLNKHLMYCLFDIIIAELYPELEGKVG